MGSFYIATVPETYPLPYAHWPRGLKLVDDISWWLLKVSKVTITTTRARYIASHQSQEQPPCAQSTLEVKSRSDWQKQRRWITTGTHDWWAQSQQDVETEYFDHRHLDNEETGNQADNHSEEMQLPILTEMLEARVNHIICTQAAPTIRHSDSRFTVHTKGALGRISVIAGMLRWYITTTLKHCSLHVCIYFFSDRIPLREPNVRHHMTALLLTLHRQWFLQYSSQLPALYRKVPCQKKASFVSSFRRALSISSPSTCWVSFQSLRK